jgi:hypothetical protein
VVAGDLIRHALRRRSWLLLLILVSAAVATAMVFVGQAALPYVIYPAL